VYATTQLDIFGEVRVVPHPVRARVTPRDYQERGILSAFDLWGKGEPGVLFRQPTGSGKTVSGSLIVDRWLSQGPNYRALVLAHERQLIQQFAEEIYDILGVTPAVEMADLHCTGNEKIIVASRATLKGSRLEQKFDPDLNWLLVIDEAHRWAVKLPSCRPIIEHFAVNPNSKRLGLTATPERTDKTVLKELFPAVASDYRLYDLEGGPSAVNDGWAVPYDQRFVVVEGVDFKNIREIAKDFDVNELERVLSEQETLARLVDPTLDLVGDRRTLIFNPGVDMAKAVALYINAKLGYESAVELDGSFPDEERKQVYRRHQRGDIQFLSVCGLCREGYNDPGIQAVAIYRPTKSRPLAEQMKGRGCRPLKGVVTSEMTAEERRESIAASTKPDCMIIDLVGVTGLADCASTAHILASGKPDEVIERANRNALAKEGPVDMAEEVRFAEFQLEEERLAEERRLQEEIERRRQKREEERLRREELLERQRQERLEYERRKGIQCEVIYNATKVGSGSGGRVYASQTIENGASDKQIGYISLLGLDLTTVPVTKAQAGRIITQLKGGMPIDEVRRQNRLPATVGAPQATDKQINFLKWKRIPVPPNCTKAQASRLIDEYKKAEASL
jgi:superfamily II DNA or RNA helicase